MGSKYGTVIGRPTVAGALVKASVEELTKDKKTLTLKFRRRKNSKRQRGFRRDVAILRVLDIVAPEDAKEHLQV
jgi:large subunit ribosomal protein L21